MADDATQMTRQEHVDARYRRRLIPQDGGGQITPGLAFEGSPAGGHLEEDDAKREDVGAVVHRLALNLFRRHVGNGAQHLPRLGDGLAPLLNGKYKSRITGIVFFSCYPLVTKLLKACLSLS